MKNEIMCHVVAGYPDYDQCLELMTKLSDFNVTAMEIQIPFSDPIADGEAIMEANDVALRNGMTIRKSFQLIEAARRSGINTEMYIMTYLQKIYHFGFEAFCELAVISNVKGLIIPDLPFDTTEYESLLKIARRFNIDIVPVVSPVMPDERVNGILKSLQGNSIYVTSRQGITGTSFKIHHDLNKLTERIKTSGSVRLFIGFGIATGDDVTSALELGDVAVIGSAIVRKLKNGPIDETVSFVRELAIGNDIAKKDGK